MLNRCQDRACLSSLSSIYFLVETHYRNSISINSLVPKSLLKFLIIVNVLKGNSWVILIVLQKSKNCLFCAVRKRCPLHTPLPTLGCHSCFMNLCKCDVERKVNRLNLAQARGKNIQDGRKSLSKGTEVGNKLISLVLCCQNSLI